MSRSCALLALTALLGPLAAAAAAEDDRKLAEQAFAVLKTYCHRCHGVSFRAPGLNVLDHAGLVAARSKDEPRYVEPGKPEASLLWQRAGIDGDMPPLGVKPDARPTAADKKILRDWIAAGAPPLTDTEQPRPALAADHVLTAVSRHLDGLEEPAHRKYQRYFTLANLYNNPTVKEYDLRLARAALSKLLNSLSWQPRLVVPQAIDAEQTVLNVDLRALGWDAGSWQKLLRVYPYGLSCSDNAPARLRQSEADVRRVTATSLPYLRADWFVVTASRGDGAELYHALLDLPGTAGELERRLLNTNPKDTTDPLRRDFLEGRLRRAGFAESNVSSQNRLVDRHDSPHGAYWKSYDFKSSLGRGNLFLNPLGPAFPGHPFAEQAFEQAGGEVIFNLPNGLQGYLLVDAKGNRIATAPVEIVSDEQKASGTPAVVNGLSCMTCHKHGMIRFRDTVRDALTVDGDARRKVQQLFPSKKDMDELLARDEERFLAALDGATGPFLRVGADKGKAVRDFPEPIAAVAHAYTRPLGVNEVAAELGLEPGPLAVLVKGNARLRSDLGLGTLARGGTIQREGWAALSNGLSLFQKTALELDLGTPHTVNGP
jgi:mono/diheme cytochrome c family protein